MTVALDVAVLAADDEHDQLLVADVRDLARRRRLDVADPARSEGPLLAVDLELRRAAVDEVELVLGVVVVEEAFLARRVDDRVDAERGHAERVADLAEAGPLAELVDRAEAVRHL